MSIQLNDTSKVTYLGGGSVSQGFPWGRYFEGGIPGPRYAKKSNTQRQTRNNETKKQRNKEIYKQRTNEEQRIKNKQGTKKQKKQSKIQTKECNKRYKKTQKFHVLLYFYIFMKIKRANK